MNRKELLTMFCAISLVFFIQSCGRTPESYSREPAKADLRNAATAQEAYFVDNLTYADSIDKLVGSEYGLSLRNGVTVVVLRADKNSYGMTSFHERGKKRYTVVGPDGEIQEIDRAD
jgi:hypothetical protein